MQHFYTPSELISDEFVTLAGEEHHHATRSCRVAAGERISVTDGRGRRVIATITEINGSELVALIEHDVSGEGELTVPVGLGMPVINLQRFETAVEKCTELGVWKIIPVITERMEPFSDRRLKRGRLERIAISAMKQSGRSILPEIAAPEELGSVLEMHRGTVLAASQHADRMIGDIAGSLDRARPILVLIGPEGDFTDDEYAAIDLRGATLFGLGGLTLRSETAAIAAVARIAEEIHSEGI